ncbi:hypothetical protein [Mesorhizobium sp. M1396]|uniref:hypothetical protein n=1 Tax=Mesorhizobium sp. M1396 TaxID=2957095 RepID=UPI003336A03D
MPRAGGVYSAPPGTAGTPNTTIESAKYNALVDDLVVDANAARPQTAGGTGATTAVGGSDNLNTAGANIASAATVNLAAATGVSITITGTVTITGFGTVGAGAVRVLTFAGILTLTHNAISLILPGAANIITAAGDIMTLRSLGSGNWACVGYQRANGTAIAIPASAAIVTPTLTLKQSAAPAPTAEGDIQWDTDDNVIVVGDGAATQIFAPLPASVATGDVFYATGGKSLARLAKGTASQQLRMNAGATAPEWFTPPSTVGAKAWVSFNGTGVVAIQSSFNVSSVTDNGTGDYTINFTNAFADTNYSVVASGEAESAFPTETRIVSVRNGGRATGSVRIRTTASNGTSVDMPGVFIAVFAA